MALDAGSVEATLKLDLDDRGFKDGDRLMAQWATKKSEAQLEFDLDERELRKGERELRAFGAKSASAELKFDVDRASLSRFLAGAGGGSRGFDAVGGAAGGAAGEIRRFSIIMGAVKWAGILAGAPAAAAALVNLGSATFAVGSALSSLAGLLVTIPQGLLGLAQGVGTVQLATEGIGDALSAYEDQQKNAAQTSQAAASQELSSAAARRSAAQSIVSAEQQLAEAHREVEVAQEALTAAQFEAERQMVDLRRAAIEGETAEDQARINLQRARRELAAGLRDPDTGKLDLAQLRTNLDAARQAYTDSQIASNRAREDANRAEREGIAGMPQVVSARRSLADAERAVTRATEARADAERDAQMQLRQSAMATRQAATQANVYKQALDQLSPSQRKFVEFLIGIRERFRSLREVAARGLFPGLQRGIESAMENFPRLRRIVGDTAETLGRVAEKIGRVVGSRGFGRNMSAFARTNLHLFEDLAGAAVHFGHGLAIILREAQPFVRWLGRLVGHLGRSFEEFAKFGRRTGAFRAFFRETARTLPQVLHLFRNLFTLFAGLGRAAAPAGNRIISFLNHTLKAWSDFSNSFLGQIEIREFFSRMVEPFKDLMRLVGAISGALLDVFGSEEGQAMLSKLTDSLIRMIPSFRNLAEAWVDLMAATGPELVDLMASLMEVLAATAPMLKVAAQAMAIMARGLGKIITTVPGLDKVVGGLIAIAGIKWLAVHTGVTKLGEGLRSVFKTGGFIDKAPGKVDDFFNAVRGLPGKLRSHAGRIVNSVRSVFSRIGARLGLTMGTTAAEATIGGQAAGEAGGGLIGRMRAGMGRLRTRLGSMFRALAARLGLTMGGTIAATTVAGEAAGEGGGGMIAGIKKRMPRLHSFMRTSGRALGLTFGLALAFGVGTQILEAFDKYVGPKIRDWMDDNVPFFDKIHGEGPLGTFEGAGGVGTSPFPTGGGERGASVSDVFQQLAPGGRRGINLRERFANRRGLTNEQLLAEASEMGDLIGQFRRFLRRHGVRGMQEGGMVSGVGDTDSVPAMLTPGEIVLPKKASNTLRNMVGAITPDSAKVTKALAKLMRKDVTDAFRGLLDDVTKLTDRLVRRNERDFDEIHDTGKKKAEDLRDEAGEAITDLSKIWDREISQMAGVTERRFSQMAEEARRRSGELSGYIRDAMREATGVVFDGMDYIADTTREALKAFDAKQKFQLSIDKPNLTKHAQGGMIGGSGRQDTVPLVLGMAAPGEAILTRYQQSWVEAALNNTFGMGLGDLFSRERRPHGFQQGGKIPGYAQGGRIGGPFQDRGDVLGSGPGFVPYMNYLNSMFGPLNVISGLRPGSITTTGNVSNHSWGGAVDISTPGLEGSTSNATIPASIGERFDALHKWIEKYFAPINLDLLWRTLIGGNHFNHIHSGIDRAYSFDAERMLDFISGLPKGKGFGRIPKIKLAGTEGPLRDISQGALDDAWKAATAWLGRQHGFGATGAPYDPHGRSGRFDSTSYGPPWGGINGTGITATGVNLMDAPEKYIVAVDPNVIPLHSKLRITPNPFGYRGAFKAEDTGGAILGNRIDFYDWRGRDEQLGWGERPVKVEGFQRGGFMGVPALTKRLRKMTNLPAIRHLKDRLRDLQAVMRRQKRILGGMDRSELDSGRAKAMRQAYRDESDTVKQIREHIHDLQVQARAKARPITRAHSRLAGRLQQGFTRVESMAARGARPRRIENLLDQLHVGRSVGSSPIRAFARSRTADVRNTLAISRAQAPVLGTGSVFAGGGYVGGGNAGRNVPGAPPIYLILDADVAAFTGRVRGVIGDREVELSRKAGLGRMTPGAIGRRAVYRVPSNRGR